MLDHPVVDVADDVDRAGRRRPHREAAPVVARLRPLALAAHYLQSAPLPAHDPASAEDDAFRERIAAWFRAGLITGSDPSGPHYWGPDASYHQHHVEMGLLAIALQIAPAQLWTPLPPAASSSL